MVSKPPLALPPCLAARYCKRIHAPGGVSEFTHLVMSANSSAWCASGCRTPSLSPASGLCLKPHTSLCLPPASPPTPVLSRPTAPTGALSRPEALDAPLATPPPVSSHNAAGAASVALLPRGRIRQGSSGGGAVACTRRLIMLLLVVVGTTPAGACLSSAFHLLWLQRSYGSCSCCGCCFASFNTAGCVHAHDDA